MLQTLTVLAFLGSAYAGDPAPPATPAPAAPTAPAATTTPAATPAPVVDCTPLTGDAKVACDNGNALKLAQDELVKLGDCTKLAADLKPACDEKAKVLNAKIAMLSPAPVPDKASKATRSNTNRMEVENADE